MDVTEDQRIWDAYNLLLAGPDIERLQKLLARYDLFKMSLDIPGDIVECGVLKGTSLIFFAKLLQTYAPGSVKRVVGFDMFTSFPVAKLEEEGSVKDFVAESQFSGVSTEEIYAKMSLAGIDNRRCDLVAGDVRTTTKEYVEKYPGLRISLLNLDLDLEDATFSALEALWDRVTIGGIVIFDEYAIPRWTESNGVDRFFLGKKIHLKSILTSRSPAAYVTKEF